MMGMLWVVLFVALIGSHFGQGLPVRSPPQPYPHESAGPSLFQEWNTENGVYAAVPALALVLAAIGFVFGCTWCYRHKDCKPNEGADNQLFSTSATHLHDVRRSHPPDSGFSEPVNNNISEDNNNGPISLREMQNIANNNAAAYIVSENEERNRVSRESVVEFEPLPSGIQVVDPLENYADWFGREDFQRSRLQYLREIGRGWFGRVVESELEENGSTTTVAVKILSQNASLEDKARFLDEGRLYRDVRHENVLALVTKCLQEDPWILIFELCSKDLQQYLVMNRPNMVALNESGVPLQLMCDVTSALAHLHSRGYLYGDLNSQTVLVRESGQCARAVLGHYASAEPQHEFAAPEIRRHPPLHTTSSEVWSLGMLIWEVCTWGSPVTCQPPPMPDTPCPYRNHLYQVMQLCWNPDANARPTSSQVHALVNHLLTTHSRADTPQGDGYGSSDFEERWQRLKPNTIPKLDEHVAIIHAPSTSLASNFTSEEYDNVHAIPDSLSVDMDTAVSRSSSIMSDKDPLSVQIKSESLTNLHGSLEDVRNIYLTHNETATLECHQGNIGLDEKEKEQDRSDSSVDPWLKEIIAGSQDDVSYYKDVSDVIKNLDNILNSEKTSSSESSHQASPSRDNLSLDCKKDYSVQSSMVKSPGISNFQNILDMGFEAPQETETCEDDEADRDTIGTLSHSFERYSDTTSQHTLENLTPDTPIKDFEFVSKAETPIAAVRNSVVDDIVDKSHREKEWPNEKLKCNVSKLPNLKALSVTSISSLSDNEQLNLSEDCETTCDSKLAESVRTEMKTKSIDNTIQKSENKCNTPVLEREGNEINVASFIEEKKEQVKEQEMSPGDINEIAVSFVEDDVIQPAIEIVSEILEKEQTKDCVQEDIIVPFQSEGVAQSSALTEKDLKPNSEVTEKESDVTVVQSNQLEHNIPNLVENVTLEQSNADLTQKFTSGSVQNVNNEERTSNDEEFDKINVTSPTENSDATKEPLEESMYVTEQLTAVEEEIVPKKLIDTEYCSQENTLKRSENNEHKCDAMSNDSTVYMDLINNTNNQLAKENVLAEVRHTTTLDESNNGLDCSMIMNESTVYLDLPSLVKETDNFLHSERTFSGTLETKDNVCSSTPKGSDVSADNTIEISDKMKESLSETKVPDLGTTLTKSEPIFAQGNTSPFDSPTKSHPTDTYEENSSVVLGPFENFTLENKGLKDIDLPKEELLAFSSNFSEINLETPSPLRDGNFLNEVPDIAPDDLQFDDLTTSEAKLEQTEPQTENTDETDQSATTKRFSPSTPPNSPGIFLASTSQQKYLVDIDLDQETVREPACSHLAVEPDSGFNTLQKEIDLNQIELQITSKLAMAENENNMNIEYSGPLTVEGLVSEDEAILRESDVLPESYLAGNGGSVEDIRGGLTLDEECVKALRNELELKLPLAQVASIEPACEPEQEWSELPPPPELVVNYCGGAGGALSPIAEETRHQLNAYENDAWNTSTRTDSSESYLEPCNNSTDEVTDLPTGAANDQSTYTIHSDHSPNPTYTIQKDIPSSKEFTMSADSLNGSPYKKPPDDFQSPINDKTFTKNDDEKESNCERISQVSPFLLSPVTDTIAPVDSDNIDNATGVSTLSKTVPTDAKLSKPIECLSKATSIDSWCSNDTLYNVEENFDDLAMDPDLPLNFEHEKEDKSESTDTLTHNDDDKEVSHCSTYIVHDSKSEACETFSPDSITANDNYTYTKVKTEATGTASGVTKSEVGDSAKNTQTNDLAYGTLPSYSNCTTELVAAIDDPWKLPQPELVRRSPIGDEVNLTPPKVTQEKDFSDSPQTMEPTVKKMDSVEITCLHDDFLESQNKSDSSDSKNPLMDEKDSPNCNYKNMEPSITSTPLTEPVAEEEIVESIPMDVPELTSKSSESIMSDVPNFQMFMQSAEIRPQDMSYNSSNELVSSTQDTGVQLDSKTLSNRDIAVTDRTPTYSDFEHSAVTKPQEVNSNNKSSQSMESGMSSGEFRLFENSVRNCPQDLSSLIDASSMLINNERKCSEQLMGGSSKADFDQTSQLDNQAENSEPRSLDISPPNYANLTESHEIVNLSEPFKFYVTDLDTEDENEQPHSIIITEIPMFVSPNKVSEQVAGPKTNNISESNESSRLTLNSNNEPKVLETLDSHNNTLELADEKDSCIKEQSKMNAIASTEDNVSEGNSPKIEVIESNSKTEVKPENHQKRLLNGLDNIPTEVTDTKCNGNNENFATVQFISEPYEELIESNVDDESKDVKCNNSEANQDISNEKKAIVNKNVDSINNASPTEERPKDAENKAHNETMREQSLVNGTADDNKIASVTETFLQNEKEFCQIDSYFPLLSDIRFTGPASEIMSTSFSQESPTEPEAPECEQDSKPDVPAEIMKEWDSDSESQSSNSSSGEFIWKQRDGPSQPSAPPADEPREPSEASGDSGSGSEGDEVEFVPSSWDCRAAPAKSSLRSLEQAPPDSKKRVVFKRQKYHCVYEYPREVAEIDTHSPAYLPDLSTYCEWDPTSAEEADYGYGQLYGGPSPLDMYPLRSAAGFGADYDEDFFISSSARPFESLGIMSSAEFFPGQALHVKSSLLERDMADDVADEFPPPPSPLPTPALTQTRTPSLDFTTPDSGVEDITPGSTSTDEDYKTKKLPESELGPWKPLDSGSSSESVSPSSPGGEALGGLRHTRDKLKLDLPPSPHIPSPRHNRVFNFVLDKPKRHRVPEERPVEAGTTPIVMTDETPIITSTLPLQKDTEDVSVPEPTFSTFGKGKQKSSEAEQKMILDEVEEDEAKVESPVKVEAVKGEGTVLDSGDEDSGIESSSKATLERKTPNVS